MRRTMILLGMMILLVILFVSVGCGERAEQPAVENDSVSSAKPVIVPYIGKSITEMPKSRTERPQDEVSGMSGIFVPEEVNCEEIEAESADKEKEEEVLKDVNDSSGVESVGKSAEDDGSGEGSEQDYEGFSEPCSVPESSDNTNSGCIEDGEGESVSEDGYADESDTELTYLGDWTTTAYCPCKICCGEWATGCTASGVLATPNHTVACGILPFGTQIMIDGIVYTVEDTGVDGEWIDIFFDTHEEALAYGMQTKEVYLVG